MITLENADKALKDFYLEAVTAQLNDGVSPFFAAIEKTANNVYGKNVSLAVVRGNCGSIAAGEENGALPDPYKNRYLSVTAPLKNLYGVIEISDKAMRASRETSGAFVNLVNAEMEGLIASAKQNFQRMLFGDGSGALCTVTARVSDTQLKVDSAKEYLVGMQVDLVPATGVATEAGTGLTIVAVDKAASIVTLDEEFYESVVGGHIYLHGSRGNELTGLGAIFDADTLYGYAKEDEPYFAPYICDGGGALTEDMLTGVLDRMEEDFNSAADMILCSYATRRKIAALIADNRRVVNSVDARTGLGVVTVNDVPVYADKYCPEDRIYFLNTQDFSLNQLCDWEWLEDEDGKILKQIPGKAAYSATLVKYAEMICKKPCAQAMLKNIG